MISNIIFIQSEKEFKKEEKKKIKNIIKTTANKAAKILKLNQKINFAIYFAKINGAWGMTLAKDFIRIAVPLKKIDEEELKHTACHEIYHAKVGWMLFSKGRATLIESLFQEGLANVFALEIIIGYRPKYCKYTKELIKKWLPEIKKEKNNKNYSHDEWFFGAKKKPFNLGYKIGTYFVEQIKKHHPELTADKLIGKNVKTLLKLSKVKL